MTQKQDGRWELTSYELIPVSEKIKPDQATQERIDALMDTVDKNYLADFGYTREEVLAENDVEFNSLEEMGTKHEELNLGDIMSDAYIYAVENSEYYDGDPVDAGGVPSGTVRDTYTKGDITVEDVFNSFSLGNRKGWCCRISADQCISDRKGAKAGSRGGRFLQMETELPMCRNIMRQHMDVRLWRTAEISLIW